MNKIRIIKFIVHTIIITIIMMGCTPAAVKKIDKIKYQIADSKKPILYVSNQADSTVSVIDGLTGKIITTINVGADPIGVAVNKTTKMVYVANFTDYNISVIDTAQNIVTNNFIPPNATALNPPQMIGINMTTNKMYITYSMDASNEVEIYNALNNSHLLTYISSPNCPTGIGVNTATNKIYIACWDLAVVDVIDANTDIKIYTIPNIISDDFGGIAVNPKTNKIYVPDCTRYVQVIDGATDTHVKNIDLGSSPNPLSMAAAINTITNRVYVSNYGINTMSVIDGSTDTVIASVIVGDTPYGVAVSENYNKIYVVNRGDASAPGTVSIINGQTNVVEKTVTVGVYPFFVDVLE